jgi:hypothetical protein
MSCEAFPALACFVVFAGSFASVQVRLKLGADVRGFDK